MPDNQAVRAIARQVARETERSSYSPTVSGDLASGSMNPKSIAGWNLGRVGPATSRHAHGFDHTTSRDLWLGVDGELIMVVHETEERFTNDRYDPNVYRESVWTTTASDHDLTAAGIESVLSKLRSIHADRGPGYRERLRQAAVKQHRASATRLRSEVASLERQISEKTEERTSKLLVAVGYPVFGLIAYRLGPSLGEGGAPALAFVLGLMLIAGMIWWFPSTDRLVIIEGDIRALTANLAHRRAKLSVAEWASSGDAAARPAPAAPSDGDTNQPVDRLLSWWAARARWVRIVILMPVLSAWFSIFS